jgi:hypothetical protein
MHLQSLQTCDVNQGQLSVFIHLLSLKTCYVIQGRLYVFYVL